MDIKAINTAIITGKFSIAELDSISDAIKYARSAAASQLAITLGKGSKVKVNHNKVQGLIGTVLKVKLKKADVDFGGRIYNVPLAMCQVV
jgi:DNA topoisomerase VI subunit B